MRLPLLVAAMGAALLAGCATEGGYYTGSYYTAPYYGYGYDYDYYGPGYYYDYGPTYYSPGFSFYYHGGDHHWNGTEHHWSGTSRSFQGTHGVARAQSRTHVAHASRPAGHRAARQPSHIASQTRTGPDREHGG